MFAKLRIPWNSLIPSKSTNYRKGVDLKTLKVEIDVLAKEFTIDSQSAKSIISTMIHLGNVYGFNNVLPVLLAQNSLVLLHEVGRSLPDGDYGAVKVTHSKNFIYVGEIPNATTKQEYTGSKLLRESNVLYIGTHLPYMGPMNTEVFDNTKKRQIGITESGTFMHLTANSRGEKYFVVISENKDTIASRYHYADGRNVTFALLGTDMFAEPIKHAPPYDRDASDIAMLNLLEQEDWHKAKNFYSLSSQSAQSQKIPKFNRDQPVTNKNVIDKFDMVLDILIRAPHAQTETSPSNNEFLRACLHLLGPAKDYRTQSGTATYTHFFQPNKPYANHATFIAETMVFSSKHYLQLEIFNGQSNKINFLFHQENYKNPRSQFINALNTFLDGMTLAYLADAKDTQGGLIKTDIVLKNLLRNGPCADGRTSAMIETLVELNLLTDHGQGVVDSIPKTVLAKSDDYLKIFRDRAIGQFAALSSVSDKDTVRIEQDERFIKNFFNLNLFMTYLADEGLTKALNPDEVEAVATYQRDVIGVLEDV